MAKKHPIQPLQKDSHGVLRFKQNKIVRYILDNGGIDLHQIAMQGFDREEQEHFAQLIGYSLSGFGELSYVSDEVYNSAEAMYDDGKSQLQARFDLVETENEMLKGHLRAMCLGVFGSDPVES